MADGAPRFKSFVLARNGNFPNSTLPVVVYGRAASGEAEVRALFERNGWPPQWTDSVFDYHHFHSTAHEALGVAAGEARLELGGPGGSMVDIAVGDIVVLPAGIAHRLESSSGDFAVVGAYPPGQDWDILKGRDEEWEKAVPNIAAVALPDTDPVGGNNGPLPDLWRKD